MQYLIDNLCQSLVEYISFATIRAGTVFAPYCSLVKP